MGAMKLVDLLGLHLEEASGTPLVLLREHDAPHRVLPIFVGGSEAAAIAVALSGQSPPRPLTHDVMATLVERLGGHAQAVEVTELRDGAFLAELSISSASGDQRLDLRPSDGIALAVRMGIPVFVSDLVLDEAGAVVPDTDDVPTEDEIDEAVAEFRQLLDDLDAADFDTPTGDELTAEDEPPADPPLT
jgi:uncharacterized protein